jgi:ABC-type sugar transport system permease subunit
MAPRTREAINGYIFVAIWIVGFLIFTATPLVQTFIYSQNKVTITSTSILLDFLGWQNYTRAIFTDPGFLDLLIGFIVQTLVSLPIIVIFSMVIALLLNMNFRFKGIFRTIFFLPVVITSGPVINELVAQGTTSVPGVTMSPAITQFIATLPGYLSGPINYVLTSFILILWFSGVQILIFISSLQKIDHSVYEAASIDGASAWEAFWKITLPSLSTTTLIVAIYTVITLSQFSENALAKYIYNQTYAVQGGIGYASAMSFLFTLALVIVLAIVYLVLSPRER